VTGDLHVSGGVGGTDAHLDDLATLAQGSDDLATTLAGISVESHEMLVDPNVLASAVLDPGGAARFEETLLSALDGQQGLTTLAVGFTERSVGLRLTVDTYRAVDEAQKTALDGLRWAEGAAAPLTVPALLLADPELAATLAGAAMTADGRAELQRLLTDHPGLVDQLVGMGPGLLSDLPGMPPIGSVPAAAHILGLLYPDGHYHISAPETDPTKVMTPPAGIGDLMASLDARNRDSSDTDDQIDVQIVTHADGTKAYVVDIPGTKAWNAPGSLDPALNDLGTNVHVLGGDSTAREAAVAAALKAAGASPTDPVMLVGHSQGGMIAAQAAHDSATGAFNYNVTHVVTAGSPIGRVDIPDNVQVLSLENSNDIVPHLDAADNPDKPNWTTVTFTDQHGTIGENHSTTTTYLPAAQHLDSSTDPSVVAYKNSADAFLPGAANGTSMQSDTFHISRTP
jgi:hypothetical protein